MQRQSSSAGVYNGLSVLFLVLALLVIVFVALRMTEPPPGDFPDVASLPTAQILPTVTPVPPTDTPRPTLPPTLTHTPTNTPSATNTEPPTLSVTPSPTITDTPGPSLTPSDTPTPSISPTPLPSETPVGPTITFTPTESPFPFDLRNQVIFGQNNVNNAGCAWQGIGGSVIELTGVETTRPFQVRVFGSGLERVVTTGSNSLYGPFSGWEVPVSNVIEAKTYFVRLETIAGTAISPDIQVTFPGDCLTNAANVTFMQQREFS